MGWNSFIQESALNKKFFNILVAFALPLCATAANAVEFNRVLERSKIGFVYKQMNVPMEGSFKRFSSSVAFDPVRLNASSARFDIDLTSIDTGATDADEEIQGKLWFNTKVFPKAQFVSSSIKATKPGRFDVYGKLTLKGKALDVIVPVDFRQDGVNAYFDGAIVIRRADFGVGEGIWSDFGTVANDVQIKFSLFVAPAVLKK